ncbi:MAG: hypothetical protein K2Y01_10655 [Rhabdochlamydiaceae bacterium]|nr:hypothetical protein [Rhabdochlamydiaceae bacterium]
MEIDFSKITLQELACFVYETLKNHKIEVVLVGGACVSIYSENRYQSMDVDFATYEELKPIEKILQKHGFKRLGRSFNHDKCPYLIDFVNPPITVGHAAVHRFEKLQTISGSLVLLLPTDCVKDRLASFFHWDDKQALDQAVFVAKAHRVDVQSIQKWAETEGFSEKLNRFLKLLNI